MEKRRDGDGRVRDEVATRCSYIRGACDILKR